jgi:hypothetical protein
LRFLQPADAQHRYPGHCGQPKRAKYPTTAVVGPVAVAVRRASGTVKGRLGGRDGSAETFETLRRCAGAWCAVLGPAGSAAYVILVVDTAEKGCRPAPGMAGRRVARSRVMPVAGSLISAAFVAVVFAWAAELRPAETAFASVDVTEAAISPPATEIGTGPEMSTLRRMPTTGRVTVM